MDPPGGHHGATSQPKRSYDSVIIFFLAHPSIKMPRSLVKNCDSCQRKKKLQQRDEMPSKLPSKFVKSFDMWGIDLLMGPFPLHEEQVYSRGKVSVDYLSKWVEAKASHQ
ncbi:hypothetical protein Tco_0628372 [Tanacetum coccineum]|uniref:Integrase zinc-binding domain-containing protein n=1 Tax=Tanacetum coccineum TaxID=301880 RepID=A0ABQ4WQ50_9ASTR